MKDFISLIKITNKLETNTKTTSNCPIRVYVNDFFSKRICTKSKPAKIADTRSENSKIQYFEVSNQQFPLLEKRLFCEFRDRLGCFLSVGSCGKRLGWETRKNRNLRFLISELWDPCIFGIRVLASIWSSFCEKSPMHPLLSDIQKLFLYLFRACQ